MTEFMPSAFMREWLAYMEKNWRAHYDYMRYRAVRAVPPPIESTNHGPYSDPHFCKRPECLAQNRSKNREWMRARRAREEAA